MGRPVTALVVFFVGMNVFAGMMIGMGVDDTLGINTQIGGDSATSSIANEDVPSGGGLGSTLFGLFVSGFYFVDALIQGVFAAPSMFVNLGFPGWFVYPIFTPMYIIAALELLFVATGRDLT